MFSQTEDLALCACYAGGTVSLNLRIKCYNAHHYERHELVLVVKFARSSQFLEMPEQRA